VIELVEGTGARYDVVVLYRPDVLLYKDMDLATYDVDACVYVNAHPEGNGDFHFVMSMANASAFKGLYASATDGNPCRVHYWIKNYVENYLHLPLRMDALAPGPHAAQEVMRKLSPRRRREIIATF